MSTEWITEQVDFPDYVQPNRWESTIACVKHWGSEDYERVWSAMRDYTQSRDKDSLDQLWCVEHPPVYTLGQAAEPHHLLQDVGITQIQTDRGGQITYHGPGQIVLYPLIDLRRKQIGVKALVWVIEQSILDVLAGLGIQAVRREGAPGIYLFDESGNDNGAKIAALGLRVKQMCSYHGLSLNVSMDLTPFQYINPCGYAGMPVTDIASTLENTAKVHTIETINTQLLNRLAYYLQLQLRYDGI